MPMMTEKEIFAQELHNMVLRIETLENLYANAGEAMKKTDRGVAWDPAAECFSIIGEKNVISAESLESALKMIVKLGE